MSKVVFVRKIFFTLQENSRNKIHKINLKRNLGNEPWNINYHTRVVKSLGLPSLKEKIFDTIDQWPIISMNYGLDIYNSFWMGCLFMNIPLICLFTAIRIYVKTKLAHDIHLCTLVTNCVKFALNHKDVGIEDKINITKETRLYNIYYYLVLLKIIAYFLLLITILVFAFRAYNVEYSLLYFNKVQWARECLESRKSIWIQRCLTSLLFALFFIEEYYLRSKMALTRFAFILIPFKKSFQSGESLTMHGLLFITFCICYLFSRQIHHLKFINMRHISEYDVKSTLYRYGMNKTADIIEKSQVNYITFKPIIPNKID